MKDNILKSIQKFLNSGFRFNDLQDYLKAHQYNILQSNIIDKFDKSEYNALWDTMLYVEDYFSFSKDKNLIIGTRISVLEVYRYCLKIRVDILNNLK